jgi:hypothetical protein
LQAANVAISTGAFFRTYTFIPVIDGSFITQRPTLSISQGKLNTVRSSFVFLLASIPDNFTQKNVFTMTNSFEGDFFINPDSTSTTQEYARLLFPGLTTTQTAAVAAKYAPVGNVFRQQAEIYGDCTLVSRHLAGSITNNAS